MYDDDYQEKNRLKLGAVYKAKITVERNPDFHRKYFGMINCAWECLSESGQEFFKSKDGFRKSVQIAAGHCDVVYSIKRAEWIEEARSISFGKMSQDEFEKLYSGVLDVILKILSKRISHERFMEIVENFM